jgi:imidazole glycerol phosphate synthase glutamine amidotransferase subunit
MIGIVDYKAGNIYSVANTLEYLGSKYKIIYSKDDFKNIDKIILPGVGAFGHAIQNLKSIGIYDLIHEWLVDDKPFLGICLGMQLLFESSEESARVKGFSIFKGNVIRLKNFKVPQIGWNQVCVQKKSDIMNDILDKSCFYFLHSYHVQKPDNDIVIGTTEYGISYASVIQKGNIYATQFHPEKSGEAGLKLIKNWIKCNIC